MNKLALLVPAAAALLAGCGGQPHSAPAATSPSGTAPTSAAAPDDTGTLVISQEGATPPRTAWYTRVENSTATPVAEASYPTGPITLTRQLPPGQYRVIAWHRPCANTCPTSGEDGLGPLAEVCGAPIAMTGGTRVTATVVIDAEGTCTVRTDS